MGRCGEMFAMERWKGIDPDLLSAGEVVLRRRPADRRAAGHRRGHGRLRPAPGQHLRFHPGRLRGRARGHRHHRERGSSGERPRARADLPRGDAPAGAGDRAGRRRTRRRARSPRWSSCRTRRRSVPLPPSRSRSTRPPSVAGCSASPSAASGTCDCSPPSPCRRRSSGTAATGSPTRSARWLPNPPPEDARVLDAVAGSSR